MSVHTGLTLSHCVSSHTHIPLISLLSLPTPSLMLCLALRIVGSHRTVHLPLWGTCVARSGAWWACYSIYSRYTTTAGSTVMMPYAICLFYVTTASWWGLPLTHACNLCRILLCIQGLRCGYAFLHYTPSQYVKDWDHELFLHVLRKHRLQMYLCPLTSCIFHVCIVYYVMVAHTWVSWWWFVACELRWTFFLYSQ